MKEDDNNTDWLRGYNSAIIDIKAGKRLRIIRDIKYFITGFFIGFFFGYLVYILIYGGIK